MSDEEREVDDQDQPADSGQPETDVQAIAREHGISEEEVLTDLGQMGF